MIWIVLLATWEAAFRVIGWRSWVSPSPSSIADGLLELLNIQTRLGEPIHSPGWPLAQAVRAGPPLHVWNSPLISANLVSAVRLTIGFGISIVLGAALGMMMWRFKALDEFLGPLFLGLQTLPSVCWVPLGIIAFGLNEQAIQFVLVMGSFFAIAIGLRDGLAVIPPLYQRAGRMLGANGWRLYRYVLLPASLPALASGLRQGFSFAWRSLMGAEFVFVVERRGLGFLLQTSRDTVDPAQVMGIMAVMVVIGMAADRIVFARLQAWVSRRFGLVAAT